MKKLLLVTFLFLNISAFGQTHYWCKGESHELTEISNKRFVLLKSEDTISFRNIVNRKGYQCTNLISTTLGTINLHKDIPKTHWCIMDDIDNPNFFSDFIYHSHSYITSTNDTLGLTHLFYVKLHKNEDFTILQSKADSLQVSIVGNNIFMPLWYTLSCTKQSNGNDMQGVQRKCVNVSGRGMVDVNITAGELPAGIYLYLLQADGQVSEAKQMIITQ